MTDPNPPIADAPAPGSVAYRRALGLLAAVVLAALVGSHLAVIRAGPDYVGPLLPLDHLFDLALASGLLLLGTAFGHHLLRRARVELTDPLDLLAFSAGIGLGGVSTLLLVVGLLGGLSSAILAVVLAGVAAVARRELVELPGVMARIPESMRASVVDARWLGAAGVALALAAAFLLCFGAMPPTDWDALMYHLEVPAAFLRAGRVFLPADNLHATVAGLLHMLYVPLLAAGSEAAPALLDGLLTLLLGLTVFRVAGRLFGGDTGAVALLLFWGTTTVLLVAITPRTDVALAFYLLLAHDAFLRACDDVPPEGSVSDVGRSPGPVEWVGLGAVILGLAVGLKFNALAYAALLAPVGLWVLFRTGIQRRVGTLLAWSALGLLAMAPWLLKNVILVGSPLYPFLAERVAEPWLDPLFPGGSAADVVGQGTLRFLRSVQDPFDLKALFFAPSRLNVESEGAFYFMNRAFLLLPLWAIWLKERRLALLLVPALGYAVLALTLDVPNVRYLVPAVPALTVAVAWMVTEVARRWLKGATASVWIAAVCAFALYPTVRTARTWLRTVPAPGHVLGTVSRSEYLRRYPDFGAFAPVVEYINGALPADARVLMLFEARGFPLHRDVLQDNKISNWPILAAARESRGDVCLTRAGFGHVLLSTAAIGYYRRRGLDPARLRMAEFDDFRQRCLEQVWETSGYVLFRRRGTGR